MIAEFMLESFIFLPRILLDGIRMVCRDWDRFIDRHVEVLPFYHVFVEWNILPNSDIQARGHNRNTMGPDGRAYGKHTISPTTEVRTICSLVSTWVRNAYSNQYMYCNRSEDVTIAAQVDSHMKLQWLFLYHFQGQELTRSRRSANEMLAMLSSIHSVMPPKGLMLGIHSDSEFWGMMDAKMLRHAAISDLDISLGLYDCTKHTFDVFWKEILHHLCNCSYVSISADFMTQYNSLFLEVILENIQAMNEFSKFPNGIFIRFFHHDAQEPLFRNLRPRVDYTDTCSDLWFPACAFIPSKMQDSTRDVYFIRTAQPSINVKLVRIKYEPGDCDYVWMRVVGQQ